MYWCTIFTGLIVFDNVIYWATGPRGSSTEDGSINNTNYATPTTPMYYKSHIRHKTIVEEVWWIVASIRTIILVIYVVV